MDNPTPLTQEEYIQARFNLALKDLLKFFPVLASRIELDPANAEMQVVEIETVVLQARIVEELREQWLRSLKPN